MIKKTLTTSLCSALLTAGVLLPAAFSAEEPFRLYESGTEDIIRYTDYGVFHDPGTDHFRYEITRRRPLAIAAGTGVYPNASAGRDPVYKQLRRSGALDGNHWQFVDTPDLAENFYKWATAPEDPGVKQYYTAVMLERMGLLTQAIKAYYALVIHFPKTTSYTYWGSPWYMGPNALDKIEILCRRNPRLGIKLVNASIQVQNSYDLDTGNDRFIVNPGRLRRVRPSKVVPKRVRLSRRKIVCGTDESFVRLVRYKNSHWQLLVAGRPYVIKGMAYSPNKTGLSPDRGTLDATRDWQTQDYNTNNIIDGPYEAWVDENTNNQQDPDEKTTGDFQLLAAMGCNTLRIYSHVINKELFRALYRDHGIMLMIGDLMGAYAVESGASWADGTDYENPVQQERMLANVRQMVLAHKDEPYTLMWVLGNENVYGVGNNSDTKPEAFFALCNRAARLIHELDHSHPVAISNGDLKSLDAIAAHAPDIDIFGANAYRGEFGFGRSFFQSVRDTLGKPVIITRRGRARLPCALSPEQLGGHQLPHSRLRRGQCPGRRSVRMGG